MAAGWLCLLISAVASFYGCVSNASVAWTNEDNPQYIPISLIELQHSSSNEASAKKRGPTNAAALDNNNESGKLQDHIYKLGDQTPEANEMLKDAGINKADENHSSLVSVKEHRVEEPKTEHKVKETETAPTEEDYQVGDLDLDASGVKEGVSNALPVRPPKAGNARRGERWDDIRKLQHYKEDFVNGKRASNSVTSTISPIVSFIVMTMASTLLVIGGADR